MEILWHRHYPRVFSSDTLLPWSITGCNVSPDNTKIVLTTRYLHVIVINKNDGSVLKAFEHLDNASETFYKDLSNFT